MKVLTENIEQKVSAEARPCGWRQLASRCSGGITVGLAFPTASIAALAGVPEHESGIASGLSNTASQIGAALGVAIVTTVAVTRSAGHAVRPRTSSSLPRPAGE